MVQNLNVFVIDITRRMRYAIATTTERTTQKEAGIMRRFTDGRTTVEISLIKVGVLYSVRSVSKLSNGQTRVALGRTWINYPRAMQDLRDQCDAQANTHGFSDVSDA